ncbi:MAG: alkaline phosphatase PhoX [Thainema sp.]
MSKLSRRQFVALMSAAAAGTALAPMGMLNARRAMAQGSCDLASFSVNGFGPISPKLPLNTMELPSDIRNVPLLSLPDKFQYTAISIEGQPMSDGGIVPGNHDGMAAFQGRQGNYILVRNHEQSIGGATIAQNGKRYDSFNGSAAGGTSTVEVDRNGRVVRDYVSLSGTIRNCAGGPTYWGSWITCEENTTTPSGDPMATKKHGYNFEVPSQLGEAVEAIPLIDMGRMNHEAVSVDPQSGYVYETEDRGDSIYYKFVPKRKSRRFGDLQEGGDLYAMVIKKDQTSNCTGEPLPTSILNGTEVVDTRGLEGGASGSILAFLGQPLAVEWVKLEDVDPEEDTLRFEAQAKGAAVWYRGEGAWYHQGKHYWVCSNAGDEGEGQVWAYDPATETVTLIVESTDENLLDGPDNITVARDGTIYLCEDGSSGTFGEPNYSQRVVGVDASGGLFNFAQNIIPGNTSEFAGACFSPNGQYMYVNSQGAGITYAIWRTDNRPVALRGFTR